MFRYNKEAQNREALRNGEKNMSGYDMLNDRQREAVLQTEGPVLILSLIHIWEEEDQENLEDWFKITLHRLVQITKRVASKYTRSKVRKALPKDFSYVIEELITEKEEVQDKEAYYNEIIHTIIRIERAPDFIIALCNLIQRLVIDHLHIVGDIYDRGKRAASHYGHLEPVSFCGYPCLLYTSESPSFPRIRRSPIRDVRSTSLIRPAMRISAVRWNGC